MMAAAGMWYPVALVSGIEPGTSNGTRLFGREIVVWRDADGASHVWEDRCPHRGMRLSFGFVRGSQIACLYHGWHYDAAGQCRYIPAHPQLTPPDTIKVPVFESAERLGMIWVRNGGAPDDGVPEDRAVAEVRSITVECSPEHAVSGLLTAGGVSTMSSPALVSARIGDDEVILGVQPLSDNECVLHIAVAGAADSAARKRISAWAEDMRRALEQPSPHVAEAAE
jgi:nitrite reductase/ring-hydroxylating ferredoxin subunit